MSTCSSGRVSVQVSFKCLMNRKRKRSTHHEGGDGAVTKTHTNIHRNNEATGEAQPNYTGELNTNTQDKRTEGTETQQQATVIN